MKDSGVISSTVNSLPRTLSFLPALLLDANNLISPQISARSSMSSIITEPTAPVAPTIANVGLDIYLSTSSCVYNCFVFRI